MIDFRLLKLVPKSVKYIALNLAFQIIGLLCNVLFLLKITTFQESWMYLIVLIVIRMIAHYLSVWMSYLSSAEVKLELRDQLFTKVVSLGKSSEDVLSDSELIQLSGEGIEQLEIYFSNYIPQFFYSVIAPVILFGFVVFKQFLVALVLLICVPLIPVSIIMVQRYAKNLLNKYWGVYTGLGDTFLDSLQGLITLKLFSFDEVKQTELEIESESFRKVTMRVLLMQLNSISVMDLVAYGGAMIAIVVAVYSNLELPAFLFIVLICAEFFIPMRLLGSYFHVAMHGASAADKIFSILDYEEDKIEQFVPSDLSKGYSVENLTYAYPDSTEHALHNLSFNFPMNSFIGIVGKSGSGKSTLVNLLMKHLKSSDISFGQVDLNAVDIYPLVSYVSHDSVVFKGTIRELLGGSDDSVMKEALDKVSLSFSLDYELDYLGANVSGGERQRLALARAFVFDSDFYIFDEVTSAVDYESEAIILSAINDLRNQGKGILMISHRISNVFDCDKIYVLEKGECIAKGSHDHLMDMSPEYNNLVQLQSKYEVAL
ncbi:MAG: ABC transporter ATP-binding protein/permease [Erysipelothrix sp.]|nr:ABC transporter ATP-binding protein/permease [Erysipelothrix sp.]